MSTEKVIVSDSSVIELSKKADTRCRYWAFILWEDSYKENYKSILTDVAINAVISPWHDKDINEGTGEIKKKHKHVLLCFDGPTSFKKANEIAEMCNGSMPIVQNSLKCAVAYWTHKNNPEKAQYDAKDIELVGYTDLSQVYDLCAEDVRTIWKLIKKLVIELEYNNYFQVVDYFMDNGLIMEFDYTINHTIPIKGYIDSNRFHKKEKANLKKYKQYIENDIEENLNEK